MTTFIAICTAVIVVALVGCEKLPDSSAANGDRAKKQDPASVVGDTVELKEGHGIALHPKLQQSISLKTAEVTEGNIAPEVTAPLHVIQGSDSSPRVALAPSGATEAAGWIAEEKARFIKVGQEVELCVEGDVAKSERGVVTRMEKSPYASLGDYEVLVRTSGSYATGTRLMATFRAPPGEAATVVPRAALLKTAEGPFVYAVNEKFYLRTPVKVGAMNAEFAEITDGLYAGDEIVVSPVNTLWMAELQLMRGCKACTCGH